MSRPAIPAHPGSSTLSLWAALVALSAGLLLFSQTFAFHGDEGFHLVAAQLINAGKRPYLDFFYQHVPLYAYVNAGWFRLFGDTWRSAHALATVFTGSSLFLVAGFVYSRIPEQAWRVPAAITASVLMGLHAEVIQNGTVGFPYGLCLFLSLAGFRLVIVAVDRASGWAAAGAGLCAGAAANASLLTAPVGPILLLWMINRSRIGNRWRKAVWFLAGAGIPFLPFLWLALQGPHQAFFDIVKFHLFYRQLLVTSVPERLVGDLRTVYALWLESTQGLVMVLLAMAGLLFLANRSDWDEPRRAEFGLCAWLVGGLGGYLACTAPTFPHYFVLVVPFLAILASVGVFAMGLGIWARERPGWPVVLMVGFFVVGLAKPLYHAVTDFQHRWESYEHIAREVNWVTPNDGQVWTEDEFIYFAARRVPPVGMGNSYAQNLPLPAGLAASLHIPSRVQQDEWLAAGRFATVVMERDDQKIKELGLDSLYRKRTQVEGYDVLWDRLPPGERKVDCRRHG